MFLELSMLSSWLTAKDALLAVLRIRIRGIRIISLDPDPYPYRFFLDPDPDPYQSSPWIRICNEFFHILDPDPYQNDTDPQHCLLGCS